MCVCVKCSVEERVNFTKQEYNKSESCQGDFLAMALVTVKGINSRVEREWQARVRKIIIMLSKEYNADHMTEKKHVSESIDLKTAEFRILWRAASLNKDRELMRATINWEQN